MSDSTTTTELAQTAVLTWHEGMSREALRDALRKDATVWLRFTEGTPARQAWGTVMAWQRDGWWLRQDIILRRVRAHEGYAETHSYLFLLTLAEVYYFDHAAIRQGCADGERSMRSVVSDTEFPGFCVRAGSPSSGLALVTADVEARLHASGYGGDLFGDAPLPRLMRFPS